MQDMPETPRFHPIGTLSTPWRTIADCPRNGRQPDPAPRCHADIAAPFIPGLEALDGFSHLILIYWLNQAPAAETHLHAAIRHHAARCFRHPRALAPEPDRPVRGGL